jgi:cysteinyl-tRNA synthetase
MSTTTSASASSSVKMPVESIRVYNTLSRTKEPFVPVEPGKVGIYLCGPTVYKEAHIGHMVGPVIFDTVARYLTYCGFEDSDVSSGHANDSRLLRELAGNGGGPNH